MEFLERFCMLHCESIIFIEKLFSLFSQNNFSRLLLGRNLDYDQGAIILGDSTGDRKQLCGYHSHLQRSGYD